MLPRIIHYCWFGKNKKSKLIEKCIKSWKKYCPDWQIIEWNEDNFDVHCCKYVEQAYQAKKWAFVSDYCRFFVLNKMGGVYVDTDVEMLKPIDEYTKSPFMAFEFDTSINPGLICGCEKDDLICKELIEEYKQDIFILENGDLNVRTVCHRATDNLVTKGLVLNNLLQTVGGYTIYPTDYFNPFNFDTQKIVLSNKTVTIHHYAGSWVDKKSKIRGRIYSILCRVFGKKFADKIRKRIAGKGEEKADNE